MVTVRYESSLSNFLTQPFEIGLRHLKKVFKWQEKESLVKYFHAIGSQFMKISTAKELDLALEKVQEMDKKYQTYLKTYCCFMRFLIGLCWWKSSVHDALLHSRRALIDKVAKGYADKTLTLLTCKYFLEDKSLRLFCTESLNKTVADTYQKKEAKGFVWRVTNSQGITSYLLGTIHELPKKELLTGLIAQNKGIQEAINSSEQFFTETGWQKLFLKLHRYDLFVLDGYVSLRAYSKKKPIFALDNDKSLSAADKIKKDRMEAVDIPFVEIPSAPFFGLEKHKIPERFDLSSYVEEQHAKYPSLPPSIRTIAAKSLCEDVKKFKKEFRAINLIHRMYEWQTGQLSAFSCAAIDSERDTRTKAWLEHSFESFDSEQPLPGLLAQIREAAKPICITVGAGHCLSSRVSLIEEFQKAGFTVSRW